MDRYGWEQRQGRTMATFAALPRGDGYTIPIVSKSEYTFIGRASSVQEVVLAAGVPSSHCVSGVLQTRVHSKSGLTATANANVVVHNVSLVPEEPDVLYLGPQVGISTSITSSSASPTLDVVALSAPIGAMLRVILRWTQGATDTASNQTVAISVDLVLRPA